MLNFKINSRSITQPWLIQQTNMSNSNQIKCPNCGTSIDVQDILSHQLEDEIKQKYQQQLADEKKKFESEFDKLNRAKEEFEEKKKQENELFQERLEKQLKEQSKAIEEKLKSKMVEEQSEQFDALQKEFLLPMSSPKPFMS